MTPFEPAIFYNDLSLTLAEIQRVIEDGAVNRHAASHNPVVANIDADGRPSQRVMILRECNWSGAKLRFHTDLRSDKITQLADRHDASVLIYDKDAKLQIRLSGKAFIGSKVAAENAWATSTEFARRCYMTQSAPGTLSDIPISGLPAWIEGKKPTEEMLISARENFAILHFEFDSIDWLYLANSGHRRAKFSYNKLNDAWDGQWLIP